jgi:hypothetical protein
MHVQPQWVNMLLFPPFVKDERGEPPMMLRLDALVKRVAEVHEARLKACHCTKEFTLRWIHPLGHREKLAFDCLWLTDSNREPTDDKIFSLQVLLVTICYYDLIHSFSVQP